MSTYEYQKNRADRLDAQIPNLIHQQGNAAVENIRAKGAAEREAAAKRIAEDSLREAEEREDYWRREALNAKKAIEMKDAILKEWMHSNEAFKRLARKYGKKLGVTDEQRQNDLDDEIISVAEEKPEFNKTNILQETKDARGCKSNR